MGIGLFSLLFSVAFGASNICKNTAGDASFCDLRSERCADVRAGFEGLYGADAASDIYGTCPSDNAAETAAALKYCAVPGLLITSSLLRNIGLRAVSGAIGVYYIADTLNQGIVEDKKCFEDNDGKKKLISYFNSKASFAAEIIGIDSQRLQIQRSDEAIARLPCAELQSLLTQKNRVLQEEVGKNLKKFSRAQLEKFQTFNDADSKLEAEGIDVSCLRPSKKAQLYCEIAAAGVGVSVIAASKLARQLSLAKSNSRLPFIKKYGDGPKFTERRKFEHIKNSVTFAENEMTLLRKKADAIFQSPKSDQQKISEVSQLYFDARISKIPAEKQAKAREILNNIQSDDHSYYQAQKIFIEEGLDPSLIQYHRTLGHEFEHAVQALSDRNKKDLLATLKKLVQGKAELPESYGAGRYRREIEAIGAQYDIIKLFPEDVVMKEAASRSQALLVPTGPNRIEVVDSQLPSTAVFKMSREDYIEHAKKYYHGYSGNWALSEDLRHYKTPVLSAAMTLPTLFALDHTGVIDAAKEKAVKALGNDKR